MFARIMEGQLAADAAEEAINYVRQSLAPALRRQPGFLNGRLLRDPGTQACLLVLVWESEADRAQADDNSFLQTLLAHLSLYFVDRPMSQSYELQVQIV
ncbi:hypothetical protein DYU11_12960 [Fibrisoma montanum]|uniref:ABM domain-containing protein n=1 Tax=Fibrisoma montanum TaxID=2305895 RepID=A0A418MBX7_9BACT|nr:antibiotic biosynthesis monooxygenase [Fibrisoma montanum]RIV23869.1 hypothetical protein DYU11_12960 [Fibrisoma montanum]